MNLVRTPCPNHPPEPPSAHAGQFDWEGFYPVSWRAMAIELVYVELHDHNHPSEGWGCCCNIQYAEIRFGIGPELAEELLRIGARLNDLPEIDRAYRDGWITWRHVVLLTNVVVPRHEAAWLHFALRLSLQELTQLVERSADGWVPPVASDGGWEGTRGVRYGTVEDASAAPLRGPRARVAGRSAPPGLRSPGRLPERRAFPASGGWVVRPPGAPNVRQRFLPPPSTS